MALAQAEPELATPLSSWTLRHVPLLAALLVAASSMLRGWLLLGGSLNGQSLVAVGSVAAGLDAPGGRSALEAFVSRIAISAAPLEYWPLAGALMALWVAYACAAAGVAFTVAASGGRRLAVLAFLLLTPMALPGMSVWPLGVPMATLATGTLLVTYGVAAFVRTGRLWSTWSIAVGTVVACAGAAGPVWSPALLVPCWAVALLVLPPHAWLAVSDAVPASRASRWSRVAAAAPACVLALAWVLLQRQSPVGELPRDLGSVASFVGESLGVGLLPAIVGGPLGWSFAAPTWPAAAPPAWLTAIGVEALLMGIASSLFLARRGLRAWGVSAGFVLASLVLIALATPATAIGSGRQMLGLAVAPALLVPAVLSAITFPRVPWSRPWTRSGQILVTFAIVDVVIVLAVASSVAWSDARPRYEGQDYVDAARESLAAAPRDVPLLPQVLAPAVASPAYAPLNRTDVAFAPLADRPAFAAWTTGLHALDEEGVLREGRLAGISASVRCTAWAPEVTLAQDLPAFTYVVDLVLSAPATEGLTVSMGGPDVVAVPPDPSRTRVFVQLTGSGNTITVSPLGAASVCLDQVRIGQVEPISPDGTGRAS